jgi:Arc/MetJ-type ribon-helix-helix transcriptional regulator
MSEFDRVALERDEKFNTRISGYIGWEQAGRKLVPTPRDAARFDLTAMVLASGAATAAEAVDYLAARMLRVPASSAMRAALREFLTKELGTDSLERAASYMEDALRMTAHLIMSTPEYQIV